MKRGNLSAAERVKLARDRKRPAAKAYMSTPSLTPFFLWRETENMEKIPAYWAVWRCFRECP